MLESVGERVIYSSGYGFETFNVSEILGAVDVEDDKEEDPSEPSDRGGDLGDLPNGYH